MYAAVHHLHDLNELYPSTYLTDENTPPPSANAMHTTDTAILQLLKTWSRRLLALKPQISTNQKVVFLVMSILAQENYIKATAGRTNAVHTGAATAQKKLQVTRMK